jgi:dCMP deaminase
MLLAQHVSGWSKDPRSKVGAVVTNGNQIVSLGYNGLPAYIPFEEQYLFDRKLKNAMTIHAEMNAISFANGRTQECSIYVTHPPCSQCAAMIIQSGIVEVIAGAQPKMEDDPVWADQIMLARDMFAAAGVEFTRYEW